MSYTFNTLYAIAFGTHLKGIETMDTQQYLQATPILDYNTKEIYDCNKVQVRKGAVSGFYINYSQERNVRKTSIPEHF